MFNWVPKVADGGGLLVEYRMYTLDELGRIGFPRKVLADGDEQALDQIHGMNLNFRKCEVWDGQRMVAALDAPVLGQPASGIA